MVPFTPECRPPNSKGEPHRRLPVWHAELKMVLTVFRIGFYSHPNAPKSVGDWGSAPDPQIARESAFGACQSACQSGINAIQKWVPVTPKCSQKRWRMGLRPRPPNSKGERLRRLPVWHAEGEGRQFPSSPRVPETLGTPLGGGCCHGHQLYNIIHHLHQHHHSNVQW